MARTVYAIATMDTKGEELAWIKSTLQALGVRVLMVDVGTHHKPVVAPDISRDQVLDRHHLPSGSDRGAAVSAMGEALRAFLVKAVADDTVDGVIGIGGSGGTALITTAFRAMPVGFPKLMVSTVASGNTEPYIDCNDITMMYSVVDVAGINAVSRRVFSNAAHAIAGMVSQPMDSSDPVPTVGMTMFGVTTPCVTRIRETLEADRFDCLVFHATGTGGRAMEKLVDSQFMHGIIDLTTTEVADEVVGGVFPAGPRRLEAALNHKLPLVLSLGAVDMVNFGAMDTVPAQFKHRTLYQHNAQVTLMRTTPQENRRIARWISDKLNRSTSPLTVFIPEGGVSALDAPGQPFYDPKANEALFETLEQTLECTTERKLVRSPHHVNDHAFADSVTTEFLRIYQSRQ